ncbi:MAG: hypothetical protein DI529_05170 [Chryseobacterium sp.]|nr:MAG: hypothetical protein DI529_05170 [Chryseobacterium sp.]
MKKAVLFLLILISMFSCRSTKYNLQKNRDDFSKIKAGKTYVFWNIANEKQKMEVTSIEKDSIIGSSKNQKIALAKRNIRTIKKNNTAGTVILSIWGAGSIVMIYVIMDTAKDIGRAFGQAIGGQ